MKKCNTILVSLALILGGIGVFASPVAAINVFDACENNASDAVCAAKNDSATNLAETLINTLLYLIGIVAVIVIILGGFRYVTSNGDQGQITAAKNIILYAVIGLIVAILAYVIVNFVVSIF